MKDYLIFYLPQKCWPEKHKKAYNYVKSDLLEIQKKVKSLDSKLRIF